MPGRRIPIVTNEVYHIFNRGLNRQPTFISKGEYSRAINTINFYRFSTPPLSLSKFLKLEINKRSDVLKILTQSKKLVEIFSFCLMPNHFHFLLKQTIDNGIAKFLSNLQNSYTKCFNTKHNRDGPLFLDQFKAVRVETEEQLVHLSRYIHLNPHTGYVINSLKELEKYPWSSFPDYLQGKGEFVDISSISGLFKNPGQYKKFVFDQANYQRELKEIEHLLLEIP